MDVINLISKAPGLPDGPITEPKEKYQWAKQHFANGPRVHEFVREMNKRALAGNYLLILSCRLR
jgi:oligo-1,6-glucosidase